MENTSLHSFKFRKSQQTNYALLIFVGLVWIVLMMIYPSIGLTSAPVGLIVFGIYLLMKKTRNDILRIYENHFEYRNSYYSFAKMIKFDKIKDIEINEKLITVNVLNTHYPIQLFKSSFLNSDVAMISEILQKFDNKAARLAVKPNDNQVSNVDDGFLLCNKCSWKGTEDELHSSKMEPNNFIYCPNCNNTF